MPQRHPAPSAWPTTSPSRNALEDCNQTIKGESVWGSRLAHEDNASLKEQEAVKSQLAVDKARRAIQAKLQSEVDLIRQVELAKAEAEHIVTDQVTLIRCA